VLSNNFNFDVIFWLSRVSLSLATKEKELICLNYFWINSPRDSQIDFCKVLRECETSFKFMTPKFMHDIMSSPPPGGSNGENCISRKNKETAAGAENESH
jgi:hypothetical protein